MSEETLKHVNVYTDGACSGNPGPGGWGYILEFGQLRKQDSGFVAGTTNNRMELMAVISALGQLKYRCDVSVYSDSAYVVNAFNDHWIDNWVKRGWKKSDGNKVENDDLWFVLLMLTKKHKIRFIKVKGHADNPYNNRCDELATGAIKEYRRINAENDPE